MRAARFSAGLAAGLLVAALGGFAVRPSPEGSVTTPRPIEAPHSTTRTVRRFETCPDQPMVSADLGPAVESIEQQKAFLTGRIAMEVGTDLDPPSAQESEEVVRAYLEDHIPDDARLWLDCSEAPCRGRVSFAAAATTDDIPAQFEDKEALWAALQERYPASGIRDSMNIEDRTFFVTFAIEDAVADAGQKKRIWWFVDHVGRAPSPNIVDFASPR